MFQRNLLSQFLGLKRKVYAEKWYGYREGRIRTIAVNEPTRTSGPEKGCFVRANAKGEKKLEAQEDGKKKIKEESKNKIKIDGRGLRRRK
jgi:hypothetical protein